MKTVTHIHKKHKTKLNLNQQTQYTLKNSPNVYSRLLYCFERCLLRCRCSWYEIHTCVHMIVHNYRDVRR